jgi:hypothetical protein
MWPVVGFLAVIVFIASSIGGKQKTSDVKSPGKTPPLPPPPIPTPPPSELDDDESTDKIIEEEIKKEVPTKTLPSVIPVPTFLKGVATLSSSNGLISDSMWTKYVRSVTYSAQKSISASYNLGMFLIGMRVLQDFGYAKNVKKQNYKGKQVFMGDWVPPASLDLFLSDATLQYEVLLKLTLAHYKAIKARYPRFLQTAPGIDFNVAPAETNVDASGQVVSRTQPTTTTIPIDRKVPGIDADVTLSGLLAVAKIAGLGGLDKWLAGDRKQATTNAFNKSNGIF